MARRPKESPAFIPKEVLYNPRLSLADKVLFAMIPSFQKESDGTYFTRSVELATVLRTAVNTALKSLSNLERARLIDVKRKEGYRGGYYIRFRDRSLLAAMLLVLGLATSSQGANSGLHNRNSEPLSPAQGTVRIEPEKSTDYNRRRRRRPGLTDPPERFRLQLADRQRRLKEFELLRRVHGSNAEHEFVKRHGEEMLRLVTRVA